MNESSKQLRFLVTAALFAAMVTVSILVFRIQMGPEIVHLGDAVIYLAACFLPKKYALVAVAIGGATANILAGIPLWAPATFVIKPLIAIWFANRGKILTRRNVIALVVAALVNTLLYYIYGALVVHGNWQSGIPFSLWTLLGQGGGSAVAFVLLAAALDKMNIKQHLRLEPS